MWRNAVVALQRQPDLPAEVIRDTSVMDGVRVVRATRIPAQTILAYLRGGHSHRDIFEGYRTLPVDGIDAVIRWPQANSSPDWRRHHAP